MTHYPVHPESWKQDKKVRFLRELVEINSGTQNTAGVSAVQDIVAEHLKRLGMDVSFESQLQNSKESGRFLISEIVCSSSPQTPFINLVTHADTVFEPDAGFLHFELNSSQSTATGPGVIDDKGGIVIALSGLERFLKIKQNKINIRFICTPTEEMGSPGFHELFKKLSQDAWMILGFEPSLEDGSIIESRKGNRWYKIKVLGCEAHAGRDHQKGINAAHELALKISHLHHLTDYSKNLTINVGQISGGSKFNIVCGEAHAKVDVRFADFEVRDDAHKKIETIINNSYLGANSMGILPKSEYEIADDCPPFPKSVQSNEWVQAYLQIIKKVEGRTVQTHQSGGSADSNYMSREGLIILDGLGATGGGMHRKNEFIHLNSLETRTECFSQFLNHIESLKP